jgi:single-stranded-DNA-specific exonuclease
MEERQQKRWIVAPPAPPEFLSGIAEHPLLLQVLYNRGSRTDEDVRAFLQLSDAVVVNPFRLQDMDLAVARIVRAIAKGETICVYGDFDADGVSATALMVTALQAAGARVGPYIPDRADEGYGLNPDAIAQIAEKATLMITVDCGIRSVAEAEYARQLGMDVIITDHHSIGPELPTAVAVINPRRDSCEPTFKSLAGVGVAYRLSQAILRAVAQQRNARLSDEQIGEIEESLLEYVALGTVADMMPLLGENRWLVQRGLQQLNQTQRPGIAALVANADLRMGTIDAGAIAFRLAPRINAAGRLAHAKLAYRLLRTKDSTDAYLAAGELEALNERRRALTEAAQGEAEAQIAAQVEHDPALLVVSSAQLPAGIVGLVAGKLVDRYYRPAVVVEIGPEESRGSARSIAEFDISAALDKAGHWLVRHGGHKQAAGFTVETSKLPDFLSALGEIAEGALPDRSDLRPSLYIDTEVAFIDLNWTLQQQFDRLEPTGQENPLPLLICRGVRVRDVRAIGGGKHLRIVVDDGPQSAVVDAVAFNFGGDLGKLAIDRCIDLVFQLEANEWQGRQRLQLNIQDWAPSEIR